MRESRGSKTDAPEFVFEDDVRRTPADVQSKPAERATMLCHGGTESVGECSPLMALPHELQLHIFAMTDTADLVALARTCSPLHGIVSRDNGLWRAHYLTLCGRSPHPHPHDRRWEELAGYRESWDGGPFWRWMVRARWYHAQTSSQGWRGIGYEGSVPHGPHTCEWFCMGEWAEKRLHGLGIEATRWWSLRVGEFRAGRLSGNGVCFYPDGSRYDGRWDKGYRQGDGVCTFYDGGRYEGEWKDDHMHGRGSLLARNGAYYAGEWVRGRRQGRGVQLYADGWRYDGDWRNDVRQGLGEIASPDGRRYSGEWTDDNHHGQGVRILSCAPVYSDCKGDPMYFWVTARMGSHGVTVEDRVERYGAQPEHGPPGDGQTAS